MLEEGMPKRAHGTKRKCNVVEEENFMMRSFVICNLILILLGLRIPRE
jgi:hypothetical protein